MYTMCAAGQMFTGQISNVFESPKIIVEEEKAVIVAPVATGAGENDWWLPRNEPNRYGKENKVLNKNNDVRWK